MVRVAPGSATAVTVGNVGLEDGSDSGIIATVLDYTNSNPLAVRLTDTSGDYVSAGAGTQYTEGATDASITGTAMLWEDTSDTLRAVSSAKPLPVSISSFPDNEPFNMAQISGTAASVNAGTLDAGTQRVTIATDDEVNNLLGTIDADTSNMATSLGNLDNAVDGNYLDVNANIAGTDIVGGAGAVAAGVQRVTLASDDPAVVDLAAIEVLLGTIDADTSSMNTDLGTVAGAVSGTEMQVDLVSANVTNAGTFAVQVDAALPTGSNAIGKLAANSGVDIGDVDVTSITGVTMSNDAIQSTGDEAHDAADAGNPVKVGLKAIDMDTDPTEVAENDRTNWYATRKGVPWVLGGHPNVKNAAINVTDADGAQTDTAIVTVGASTACVVTSIAVAADNANTGDVQCRIGFGTTNTPAEDAAKQVLNHPGIAAGSGMVIGSGAGIIGQGAANEDLRVTCEDPAGGSLSINVTYFTIAI